MKKGRRTAAVCLVLSLLLLLGTGGVSAASDYRLIYNDSAMDTMPKPLERSGTIYISCDLLPTLKTSYTYEGGTQTFVVFKGQKIWAFDMVSGNCITEDNNSYSQQWVFYDSGTFYIPAAFVAQQLGFSYSRLEHGLIRITGSGASLTNAQITEKFAAAVPENPAQPVTPLPPVIPVTAQTYYLALTGKADTAAEYWQLCQSRKLSPTFFWNGEELAAHPQQVRELAAKGASLGLSLAEAELTASPQALVQKLEAQNDLFQKITKTRACLVLLPGGVALSGEQFAALTAEGYRLCSPDVTLRGDRYPTREQAAAALKKLVKQAGNGALVALDSSSFSLTALRRLSFQEELYANRALNEFTAPVLP